MPRRDDAPKGRLWWCERPDIGRRPMVVLSRDSSIGRLRRVVVAPRSSGVPRLTTEVVVEPGDDPVAQRSVHLDSLHNLSVGHFVERMGRLTDVRMRQTAPPSTARFERQAGTGLYIGSVLNQDQIDGFERDGYLAIEGFASAEACASLRRRAIGIVEGWQPSSQRTVFSTDQQERTSNREFLESGSSIWCFFEADAFDERGELAQEKLLSINKIGHAMHDLDPVFESFSYTADLAGVATDIGMVDPLAIQSMYIFKQPRIGGEVACHQDATFLPTDPLTVTGFWFAIEDATLDNGCLWVAPGGHRGPLRQRFERAGSTSDDGTRFVPPDGTPLPEPPDGLVPVEAPAGTLVVLHGLLPHWSDANRSATSRHAYSLHCVEAAADYPATNWLQRPATMPLRSLLSLRSPATQAAAGRSSATQAAPGRSPATQAAPSLRSPATQAAPSGLRSPAAQAAR